MKQTFPVHISVIIPICSVEQYIERCVRSLMEQTLTEGIEFIFINDATPDRSMQILEQVVSQYPDRQSQIQIVNHAINQGIAFTRGEGLRLAQGEYIGWCDSDDWCERDMFQTMYEHARCTGADAVICAFSHEYEDYSELCDVNYPATGIEYVETLYRRITSISFLWNKLIRRSIFIEHDIYPYEGINISEDMNLVFRAMYYAGRVECIHRYFYHHENTPHSSLSQHANDRVIREQNYQNGRFICAFLTDKDATRFQRTCSFIVFMSKIAAYHTFDDKREYYNTFRSSHRDLIHFTAYPLSVRLKWMLIYSSYYSLRLYHWIKD